MPEVFKVHHFHMIVERVREMSHVPDSAAGGSALHPAALKVPVSLLAVVGFFGCCWLVFLTDTFTILLFF